MKPGSDNYLMLKWVRLVSICLIVTLASVAAVFSLLALTVGAEFWVSPLISTFAWLPLHRLSSGSEFGTAGLVNALFSAFAVLPAFTGSVAHIMLTYRPKWCAPVELRTRAKGIIGSMVLISIPILLLITWNGGDVRIVKFGSSLLCMVLLGWAPYAFFGAIFAYGTVGLWKSITND
ncbi:hypothetical protein [Luteibacter sp. 9135]|uniref:hypothetical protein n=1 Tax=Luteibacter sp. 9135 TaxID=1500893 RepID=UPI001639ADDA|nr:hypothetical protein [Luteibacter sp. 9135]